MITELKPTNLIAVEIDTSCFDYKISGSNWVCISSPIASTKWTTIEKLADGKYKIIGELTKYKISFDVEPYVGKDDSGYLDYFLFRGHLQNYCETKEKSFYSLLEANGLYFANPMRNFQFDVNSEEEHQEVGDIYYKWKFYEKKLIKNKLLIIEKN